MSTETNWTLMTMRELRWPAVQLSNSQLQPPICTFTSCVCAYQNANKPRSHTIQDNFNIIIMSRWIFVLLFTIFFCSSKSWLKDNLSCSSIQEGPLAAFLFEHSGGQLILNDNVKHYCFYFNPSFLLNFTVAYFFFIRFLFSFLLSF